MYYDREMQEYKEQVERELQEIEDRIMRMSIEEIRAEYEAKYGAGNE